MVTRRETLAAGVAALAVAGAGGGGNALAKAATGGVAQMLDTHDAMGLAALVRQRQVSASELLEAAIARTEALNPRYNFMAQKLYDRARAAVKQGVPDGPFAGVPWLIKDLNTHIAGEITSNGSRLYKDFRPTVTSELVKRYERAGLVIFGKTTSPEFGLTGTTENKVQGLTRNPWNPEYTTGGSSGGSAAAVAAGVLPAAHATDGGGSIRIPAACCGLFGMKPSRGRIPMGPPRTEGWGGLSAHHAVTKTVRDSAALMDATWGLEPGSRYSAPTPDGTFLSQVGKNPGKLRVALMITPPSGSPVDPEVAEATRNAARLLESLGHHVEEAAPKLDAATIGWAGFVMMASSVAADTADRAKLLGITLGPDVLEKITLSMVEFGKTTTGMDFARASATIQGAAITVGQFMEQYDVILTPTLAAPPLRLGQISLSSELGYEEWGMRAGGWTPYTQLANLTGQPAMSMPLAMSAGGLPIGIQVFGRYGDEALLYRLAGQVEQAAPWIGRKPKIA